MLDYLFVKLWSRISDIKFKSGGGGGPPPLQNHPRPRDNSLHPLHQHPRPHLLGRHSSHTCSQIWPQVIWCIIYQSGYKHNPLFFNKGRREKRSLATEKVTPPIFFRLQSETLLINKMLNFRKSPLSESMCELFPVFFYAIIGASLFRHSPSNLFFI